MHGRTALSRKLRKNQTDAERLLWKKIRYKKLGSKFRRQFPITYMSDKRRRFFIPDFICLEKKLIIEVDGGIHEMQREKDAERTEILNNLGYTVIRFSNSEVFRSVESVVAAIKGAISK